MKKARKEKNDQDLRNQIQTYKKMSALRDEMRKRNSYFFNETLENARSLFRFRVDLLDAKMNFKGKYKNDSYLCDSCESESDLNTHVLFCPAYISLRQNKSLNCDRHLAIYLQQVLEIRTNLRLNR